MKTQGPRLLVYSSLFPSDAQPNAGLFIRERMFRVARQVPIVVVAPQPWFPGQALIRLFRPHFRPMAARREVMQGIEVLRPRFLCVPGVFKRTDGVLMAVCTFPAVWRAVRASRLNIIDAHFGYPDGRAATLLGRWLRLPVVLTVRGKEERQLKTSVAAPLRRAMIDADRVIAVSSALRDVALKVGVAPTRLDVIGNGVDSSKFHNVDRAEARVRLKLPADAKIIVSVGTLVERKGMHRIIELMPRLLQRHPALHYLIVGGPGPEGDMSARLRELVEQAGLVDRVHFPGAISPAELKYALSSADVFVLATSYEGWANVLLEAMACGLPIVTTDVGGNAEVVDRPGLGMVVPFGDAAKLEDAISAALMQAWDRAAIIEHAQRNTWESRISSLLTLFHRVLADSRRRASSTPREVERV